MRQRVLVIEDNPNVSDAARRWLTDAGFDVECVRTIREAQLVMQSQAFDCVVADLTLPNGAGLEVVRAIRALDADIPLIVWTADDSENVAIEAVELYKVDDVLVKGTRVNLPRSVKVALKRREVLMPDKDDPMLTIGPTPTEPPKPPTGAHKTVVIEGIKADKQKQVQRAEATPIKSLFIATGHVLLGGALLLFAGWLKSDANVPWFVWVTVGFGGFFVAAPNTVRNMTKFLIATVKDALAARKASNESGTTP